MRFKTNGPKRDGGFGRTHQTRSRLLKSVVRIGARSKGGRKGPTTGRKGDRLDIDARAELIQALIPIGLEAVNELLQQEVTALAGARYGRGVGRAGYARWGRQTGSVDLGHQKVAVTGPLVRDLVGAVRK